MSEVKAFEPRPGTVSLSRAWGPWAMLALFPLALFAHPGFFLLLVGGLASMTLARFLPRKVTGLLRVDASGLSVDGVTVVPRDRIGQAVRFSRAGAAVVYILRRRALPVQVELSTDADARELLEALSMDDARATAGFQAWSGGMRARMRLRAFAALLPIAAVLATLVTFSAGPGSRLAPYAGFVAIGCFALGLFVSAALGIVAYARRASLVVGADGVLVRGALGRSVFYGYREMRDVGLERKDIVWTRASDDVEAIRFGIDAGRGWLPAQAKDLAKACFTRIVDARARHLNGEGSSDLATVLTRGGRDVSAWRRALEALLTESVTYRTAALPATRLWRVLEDPTQPEGARAGAAVALRASFDDEAKVRVRVATAACASSELRRAFEATLEESSDEVVIERALKAFRADAR